MCMRIYLEQLANEALGVPTNIVETAFEIYDKLIENMAVETARNGWEDEPVQDSISKTITINGNFQIADYNFQTVNITIKAEGNKNKIDPDDKGGAFIPDNVKVIDNHTRIVFGHDRNNVSIVLDYLVNNYNIWGDVVDFINTDLKRGTIKTLAHELKHAYDSYKTEHIGEPVKSRSRYAAFTSQLSGARSLGQFNYFLYYSHYVEDLIRPTEFAAELRLDNVDKKSFLKVFRNSNTYGILKEIEGYTFEGLKQSILDDKQTINAFREFMKKNNMNVPDSDEEITNIILLNYHQNFKSVVADTYAGIIKYDDNPLFKLLGIGNNSEEKKKVMMELIKDLERFKSPETFFRYEIKKMNRLAFKTIRKLAKLYAYL